MANQGASASSAPFTKSWKYHVFLSFRGKDTRLNFTSHLYSALRQQGINTFKDDNELRIGEEISSELLTAIEDSKISVVVFSENYASSKWCLDELVKILDCKESNQQLVIPVFYKVNPSDVLNHRGSFEDALANLGCNNVEKVNRWRAALSQAGKLAGFTLPDDRESESEAEFIQKIIGKISAHVIDRTDLKVAEHLVGMQSHVQDMNKLLDLEESDVRMVGVWGSGGTGKTTVAKVVYNVYNSIFHQFEGGCFLANVREGSTSHQGLAKLQKTLLSEILRGTKLKVTNVDKGATMIKERLSCRKVLLVLDDVNDMEQLYKLAGACDWFGAGSRIIITTRDKRLLTNHDVNLIHEVKILYYDEAMELFCWHAFKRRGPPLEDYAELTNRAIRYAQGLPLALKVLGSCLCGGTIDKWEATLHGFKSTKIQDVLKISYNALDDRVKQVFLDLACFFKGERRERVTEILEACDLNPGYGIEVLIEKALISVEGHYIQMHDLLEEMGKDIVEQESPTEPGERSRLWYYKDVDHVLTNDTGTNKITGIMLNPPIINYEILLDVDCFLKMKNLKIFVIKYGACISGDIGYLPNTLRVLEWHRCPLQSFPPNFRAKELVVLSMTDNNIKQPEGLKHFTTLTSLNLGNSKFLTAIPDLSASPNLKSLNATGCASLVEVHPSVGYLDKLQELDFSDCPELTKFPNKIRLKSLTSFRLCNCIKLESFPEIVDKIESLYTLDLEGTGIKELPASFGHLTALQILTLARCANLAKLPQSIYGLQNLTFINLSECPKLVTLPNNLNSQVLSSAQSLPLEAFSMQECNVSDINSLENICCWSNVKEIYLYSTSNFVSFPMCITKLVNLRVLSLVGCTELVEIVVQLPAIEYIYMEDCISLERFSTLSKILEYRDMQHIRAMELSNCQRLCDNIGLDAAKMANILVNQAAVTWFNHIILPGSEVPESFSYRKDVDVLLKYWKTIDLFDCGIEIEILIEDEFDKLDELKLVLCIFWEMKALDSWDFPPFWLSINHNIHSSFLLERALEADHVALFCIPLRRYIPLRAHHMKPKGDDDGDDQLKPSVGRIITVSCKGRLLIKSFGAQLSCFSMPKHGFRFWLMPKDGDDDKNDGNEDEDELDDDGVGDDGKNDEDELDDDDDVGDGKNDEDELDDDDGKND